MILKSSQSTKLYPNVERTSSAPNYGCIEMDSRHSMFSTVVDGKAQPGMRHKFVKPVKLYSTLAAFGAIIVLRRKEKN